LPGNAANDSALSSLTDPGVVLAKRSQIDLRVMSLPVKFSLSVRDTFLENATPVLPIPDSTSSEPYLQHTGPKCMQNDKVQLKQSSMRPSNGELGIDQQ
jgi:hypothetical protein